MSLPMRRDRAWQVGGEAGDQTSAAKFLKHNTESKSLLTALEIAVHKVGHSRQGLYTQSADHRPTGPPTPAVLPARLGKACSVVVCHFFLLPFSPFLPWLVFVQHGQDWNRSHTVSLKSIDDKITYRSPEFHYLREMCTGFHRWIGDIITNQSLPFSQQ